MQRAASTGRRERTVLVAGGGVAGPVLGMFLRCAGLAARVFEARPADDEEGAFLGLAPNGMNVLGELGCAREVAALGAPSRGFTFLDARGRVIGAIAQHDDERRYGAPMVMVRRPRLQAALVAQARLQGVEVAFGRRLVDLAQDAGGVTARFDDGSSASGDLLVGADGLRSRVRSLALPGSPAPAPTGLQGLAGFAPLGDAPLPVGHNVMVFGRRAFFGAFRAPDDLVWWFHNSAVPLAPPDGDWRRALGSLHAGDPPWVTGLIERTGRLLGPWPEFDLRTLPRWHAGRVCLVGDAAHATSPSAGQGASMALEDALVLARCLRDDPTPGAFAAFERARRARVEDIVRQARRNGGGKSLPGPVAAWCRDRLMPLFLRLGASAQRRAHAYRVAWNDPPPTA